MYKVKFGGKNGKTFNLVESPDMVAIRTKGNQALENVSMSRESKNLIDQTTEVVKFPEAGITVRRVAAAEGLESTQSMVDMRDETRAALKQEDGIRFAGRVLQDAESGEVMLYTENFFVKFKDEISEKDCLALIDQYQLKVKSKLPFAPNSYFVEAVEGTGLKVFDIAERLLKEKIVTQIVRETTLTPDEFRRENGMPIRRVEDPATIAWKLGTGAYYKAGGKPWQLADVRPGVCYVGLVYKRSELTSDKRHACCAAQMFLSDGEGVVFRGARSRERSQRGRASGVDTRPHDSLVSPAKCENTLRAAPVPGRGGCRRASSGPILQGGKSACATPGIVSPRSPRSRCSSPRGPWRPAPASPA